MCALAVSLVATAAPRDQVDRAVAEACIVGVPLAVGLWAARSPRTARFGLVLLAAAALWSLTALAETPHSLSYSIGRVAAWLIFPAVMYLMLAFPRGHIRAGADRTLYRAVILLIALLYVGSALFVESYPAQTPWATCDTDCPANAFLVLHHEPALMQNVIQPLRELLAVLVLAAIAVSLVRRLRAATPLGRRLIGPLTVMSVVFNVLLAAFLVARALVPGEPPVETLGVIWSFSVPALAAAFFVGLLQRRLAIGEVLRTLSDSLSGQLDERRLRSGLVAALGDPGIDVLYPGTDGWHDTEGATTSPDDVEAAGQALTPVRDGEVPIALLVHDAALHDDELLDAVATLVRSAFQHEQLTHQLEASLGQLEDSRQRIARAADRERARIERDLHDGAQQRLVSLRIKLSLAEELLHTDAAAGAEAVRELGDDVELALEELRALAHGVYPPLLSDRGLSDALRSVLVQSPLRGHLEAHGVTRHSTEIESAVYFACLEAVQNAIKHAEGASGIWLSLWQSRALRFEVRDDGPGFFPPGFEGNGGLRNMHDRLDAIGGRVTVDSAPGHGTRVYGAVPLG
jgi:signal transduction histidine kinase